MIPQKIKPIYILKFLYALIRQTTLRNNVMIFMKTESTYYEMALSLFSQDRCKLIESVYNTDLRLLQVRGRRLTEIEMSYSHSMLKK